MSSKQHISGILTQYIGKRDEVLADLDVYLRSPVGVGEHSDIGQEIRTKIKELDKLDSLIGTIKNYFGNDNTAQESTSSEVE
tara:strand:+ start:995 stop:1240 length:246 start_codon:yes stop_codon:yes gene_type:complete